MRWREIGNVEPVMIAEPAGTAAGLGVERERARRIAGEGRFPRQERVRERRRLRLLADAVGGQQRQRVPRCDVEQARAQPADLGQHRGQPLSQVVAPRDCIEVAGAASEVDPAGDVGAELLRQKRFARVPSAAHSIANRFDALRFHLAQPGEDRARGIRRDQSRFGERDGMRLVESVEGAVASSQVRERAGVEALREARVDLTAQARTGLTDDVGHCAVAPRRGRQARASPGGDSSPVRRG